MSDEWTGIERRETAFHINFWLIQHLWLFTVQISNIYELHTITIKNLINIIFQNIYFHVKEPELFDKIVAAPIRND